MNGCEIATNAEVVFDEPIDELEKEAAFQFQEENVLDIEPLPEAAEIEVAEAPVEEPALELPIEEKVDAPEDVQEQPAPELEVANDKDLVSPLIELVDDIIAALEDFRDALQ